MDMETIYREYHDKVLSYIRYKVHNGHDAEDICSDVFIKVQKGLDKYDEEKASLARWIYVIAGNTVIDYYRSHRESEEIPEELPGDGDPADDYIREEKLQLLKTALQSLTEEERLVVVLHYYEGMKFTEIGRRTGLSYGQVKLRNNSALKSLRKLL